MRKLLFLCMLAAPILSKAQTLDWFPRSILLARGHQPRVDVRNPGRQAVRIDSMETFSDAQALGELFWSCRIANGPTVFMKAWPPLFGKNVHEGIYVKRDVDSLKNTGLSIPAGGSLVMNDWGYDPCPICKQTAASAAPSDTGHIRLIFHAGREADTVDVVLAPEELVSGLRAVRATKARATGTAALRWDAAGRRFSPQPGTHAGKAAALFH